MSRLVLDAGAFVAFDKADARTSARLTVARQQGFDLITTSPVIAQVWRSGRQALLARLIAATRVEAPDESAVRQAGQLLAKTKTSDVVDALLVGTARDGDVILTSDPHDLRVLTDAAGIKATIVTV